MAKAAEGFSNVYKSLADEELLNLALQREQLSEHAVIALNAELSARDLGEGELRDFRESDVVREEAAPAEKEQAPATCEEHPEPPATQEQIAGFSAIYQTVSDDELVRLAAERKQLTTAARVALEGEISARHLEDEVVRAQSSRDADTGATDQETEEALSGSDWERDEEELNSGETIATLRPKGVLTGAFLFWLGGILGVWMASMAVADASSAWLVRAGGILDVLLATAFFVTGFGLWHLRSWGRKWAVALCWLGVLTQTLLIAYSATTRLRGFAVDPAASIGGILSFFFALLWARYFGSEKVRTAFDRAAVH